MANSQLQTLFTASQQDAYQSQGLTAAYVYLGFGVPSVDGYAYLIANNDATNFGSGSSVVFNQENVYINSFVNLVAFNPDAAANFAITLGGATTLAAALTAVYNSMVPASEQTVAGRTFFLSEASYYEARAAEFGLTTIAGQAAVGAAALANILVNNNVPGLGAEINNFLAAVADGSAVVPQTGDFTPILDVSGPGKTTPFALTPAVDVFDLSNGHATAGNDAYTAVLATTGTTYNTGDSVDGGAGQNSFKIIATDSTSQSNQVELHNIQTVSVQASTGLVLDASQWNGVKTFELVNSTNKSVQIANIAQPFSTVNLTNVKSGQFFLSTANDVFSGAADTVAVKLDNAGSLKTGNAEALIVQNASGAATVETYAVNSAKAAAGDSNFLWLTRTDATKAITVSGSADVAFVLGSQAKLTSVDASAATGGVDFLTATNLAVQNATFSYKGSSGIDKVAILDASGTGSQISVSTGAGNDTVNVLGPHVGTGKYTIDLGDGNDTFLVNSATNIASTDSVDGGAGTDTLAMLAVTTGNGTAFKNFELLDLANATGNYDANFVIPGSVFTGITVTHDAAGDVTLSNVGFSSGIKFGAVDFNDITLNFSGASGASDVLDISTNSSSAAGQAGIVGTLSVNGIETVNITSSGVDAASVGGISNLTDTSLKTLNITGANDFSLAALQTSSTSTASSLTLVDGSSATGHLNLAIGDQITGVTTPANLTFGVNLGKANDFLSLSFGAATTKVETVNVSLTAGGVDSIDLNGFHAGANVSATSVGSIVNLTGAGTGDVVDFLAAGQVKTTLGRAQDVHLATSLEGAVTTAIATNTATNSIVWFNRGSDSYIVDSADATYDAADTIVKVVGVADLSHATLDATGHVAFA